MNSHRQYHSDESENLQFSFSGALLPRLRMTSPGEPAARAVLATLAVVIPTTDLVN
jgi:hypothetical protein